jgi:hypothetical protein
MVALTPRKTLQKKVATAMENRGFKVLKTRIGHQKEQPDSPNRRKKRGT